jgi:UDP-N-acetylglucosamine--N-acetylmuramyl-(pentapeptide) pyrophosphoryl-undecaprenol N-acetylglucosamine transferase
VSPLVVLAAGGTGGHMFPAEALAQALIARGAGVALITDRRGQAFGGSLPAVAIHRIRASRLPRHTIDRIRAVFDMGLGVLDARLLLRKLRPACIVGFGGYASIPTVLAAAWLGTPIVLHEQNAVLGRANRGLARRARVIATSFPSVQRTPAGTATRFVGNPVRPGIAAIGGQPYLRPAPDGPFRLLVLGGSQGARVFSEIVPAAVALLPAAARARLRITQQCRPEDIEAARAAYQAAGINAELSSFFTDVPARLASCHLAIMRSGASTIAELGVAGRPAILAPYPFATDDHQTANAEAYAAAGGGWVMAQRMLTPAVLAGRLTDLMAHPDVLASAAEAARKEGRPDAADRLSQLVLSYANARPSFAAADRLKDAAV